jgi:hypothetical protein
LRNYPASIIDGVPERGGVESPGLFHKEGYGRYQVQPPVDVREQGGDPSLGIAGVNGLGYARDDELGIVVMKVKKGEIARDDWFYWLKGGFEWTKLFPIIGQHI